MPKYLVKEKSFINNAIREVGDTVDYDGPVASNLEAVDGTISASTAASDAARQALAAKGVESAALDAVKAEQEAIANAAADKAKADADALTAQIVEAAAQAAASAVKESNANDLV